MTANMPISALMSEIFRLLWMSPCGFLPLEGLKKKKALWSDHSDRYSKAPFFTPKMPS